MSRRAIFVSAVSDEFGIYRDAIRNALDNRPYVSVETQEYFPAAGLPTLIKLDDLIKKCDAVIHLVGNICGCDAHFESVSAIVARYPNLASKLPGLNEFLKPGGLSLSYTQWEALLAKYHGKPLFLAKPTPELSLAFENARDDSQVIRQRRHLDMLADNFNVHPEIVFGSIDDLIHQITKSRILCQPAGLDHQQREQVADFLDEYRNRANNSFGGRCKEIAELAIWAGDATSPALCVIAAPMGRGKSMLLVQLHDHLIARQTGDTRQHIVFVPVSLRFETNEPGSYLRLLEAGLAGIAEESNEELSIPRSVIEIERACKVLIRRLSELGKTVLIILDGLDESSDAAATIRWFDQLPKGKIKLLVSVRLQYEMETIPDWLRRWGWIQKERVQQQYLTALDFQSVESMLRGMGVPENDLQPPLVHRLWELSEGEPFLLTFYADDLWFSGSDGQLVVLEMLQSWMPGFKAYFKRLMENQMGKWPPDQKQLLHTCLLILACSRGPLSINAIEQVLQKLSTSSSIPRISEVFTHLRRFVVGGWRSKASHESIGMTLVHGKLTEYFLQSYFTATEQHSAEQAFITWGLSEIDRLRQRLLSPESLDSYLISWLHLHLSEADLPIEVYAQLFGSWWRDAHLERKGHIADYIRDLDSIAHAIQRRKPSGWRTHLIRCNVLRAAAVEVSNVPPGLTVAAVRNGLITAYEARHALSLASKYYVWEGWLGLAKLPGIPQEERNEFVERAIDAAEDALMSGDRVAAYARLSEIAPASARETLLAKAWHKLETTHGLSDFLKGVSEMTPRVNTQGRYQLLYMLLQQHASFIGWDILEYLLPFSPREDWTALAEHAFTIQQLQTPENEKKDGRYNKSEDFLAVTFLFMTPAEQAKHRTVALQASRQSSNYYCKAMGLAGLAATASGEERVALINEAVTATRSKPGWADEIHLATYLASVLTEEERPNVLVSTMQISLKAIREKSINQFKYFAHLLERTDVVRAFNAVLDCPKLDGRLSGFEALAPMLDGDQVRRARETLKSIGDREANRAALLTLIIDWPELTTINTDLTVEAVLRLDANRINANLFEEVRNRVRITNSNDVIMLGLNWWVDKDYTDSESASAAWELRTLWPASLDLKIWNWLSAEAIAQHWTANQLFAYLKGLDPEAKYRPPPPPDLESDFTESESRSRNLEFVREWVDCMMLRSEVDSNLSLDDILKHREFYPKSLQRDCLEAFACAWTRPMPEHKTPRRWFIDNLHRIAPWVHSFEGIDGLSILVIAVRELEETFG